MKWLEKLEKRYSDPMLSIHRKGHGSFLQCAVSSALQGPYTSAPICFTLVMPHGLKFRKKVSAQPRYRKKKEFRERARNFTFRSESLQSTTYEGRHSGITPGRMPIEGTTIHIDTCNSAYTYEIAFFPSLKIFNIESNNRSNTFSGRAF